MRLARWLRDFYRFADPFRMWPTALVAGITVAIVWWIAPQQLGILVYTMAKLSLAGYLAYWLDRWCFPDSRPGLPRHREKRAENNVAAEYRRAAIMCAALIATGLLS